MGSYHQPCMLSPPGIWDHITFIFLYVLCVRRTCCTVLAPGSPFGPSLLLSVTIRMIIFTSLLSHHRFTSVEKVGETRPAPLFLLIPYEDLQVSYLELDQHSLLYRHKAGFLSCRKKIIEPVTHA